MLKEEIAEVVTEAKEKKKKKEVTVRMERGVETMFRVTYSNHSQISSMADSKTNILISVTSISISVVLFYSAYGRVSLPDYSDIDLYYQLPCRFNPGNVCTRPNLTPNTNSAEVEQKKRNLLFFGNFTTCRWKNMSAKWTKC